jgi:predicted Fe-S protein YdhL (DUF1289 family)
MQHQQNTNEVQRQARVFTKPCQGLCDKFDDGICNGWCFLSNQERSAILKSRTRESNTEAEVQKPSMRM